MTDSPESVNRPVFPLILMTDSPESVNGPVFSVVAVSYCANTNNSFSFWLLTILIL